jgi:tripartite-type tricarboxylate transporter receptor subunit TctC
MSEFLPGFSAEAAIGFFVPKKTSPAIVGFLNREMVQALKGTDRQLLVKAAVEVVADSPEQFSAFIKSDMARMSKMLKSAHFTN